jgi:hypothetical protein
MKCQNCKEELPDSPEEAVENDELNEIVSHKQDGEGVWASKKDYYCDPECFIEAKGGNQ